MLSLCCKVLCLLAFSSTEAGVACLQDWGGGCSLLNSTTGLPQNCTGNGQVELPFGSREYLVSCSLISLSFMSFRTRFSSCQFAAEQAADSQFADQHGSKLHMYCIAYLDLPCALPGGPQ